MGSSKKSKDKDREREHKKKRRHKSRSRSRSPGPDRKHHKKHHRDPRERQDSREKGNAKSGYEYDRASPNQDDDILQGNLVESHGKRTGNGRADPTDESADPSGGGGNESLSIDETNRLRAKLGLKPLDSESSKKDGDDECKPGTDDFVHKAAVSLTQEKKSKELQEKLLRIKEKRRINQKLGKVRTLGESDSEDEEDGGALAWIKKTRMQEKEKKLAGQREKQIAEMDEVFGVSDLLDKEFKAKPKKNYGSKDLRGLKVEHDQDAFVEGRTTILTLKDAGILDEDPSDVLVNPNMVDDEFNERNMKNKLKKAVDNPWDEPTIDEYGMMPEKNILKKYDEEIDGEKIKSFDLGSGGKYDASHERFMKEYKNSLLKSSQNLELPKLEIAKEFYTHTEMDSFKKVKKKVRKIRKKPKNLKAEDLIPLDDEMLHDGADLGSRNRRRDIEAIPGLDLIDDVPQVDLPVHDEDAGVDIDDTEEPLEDLTGVPVEIEATGELNRMLNRTRRLKNRDPEQSAAGAAEAVHARLPPAVIEIDEQIHPEDSKTEEGHISMNMTSEFCRALGDIPTYGQAGNRLEEEEDELLDFERELAEKRRLEELEEAAHSGWNAVDKEEEEKEKVDDEKNVLDDEPQLDLGLGAALKLATTKGFLDNEEQRKGAASASRVKIESKNWSIDDKKGEDKDDKYSRRDRFSGGMVSDFKELSYKPTVHLDYVDEHGRELSQKEAFRQLSHRFHGKASGKRKTEKRERKFEQAELMRQTSSTDTPLGTVQMLRQKQKSEKSAYLILSGSNKATLSGASSVSK